MISIRHFLSRFRPDIRISTLALPLGCVLVTLASKFHWNVTLMKYGLGMLSWIILDGEYEPPPSPLDYFAVGNIPNILLFAIPFAIVVWRFGKHVLDWLPALMIVIWLVCTIWMCTDETVHPVVVWLSVVAFLLPALTITLLFEGSRTIRALLFAARLGAPLWLFAMGWVLPVFVPVFMVAFLIPALGIVLLARTHIGHRLPGPFVVAWAFLFLWVYQVGPVLGP